MSRSKTSNRSLIIVLLLLIVAGALIYKYTEREDKPSFNDQSLIGMDTADINGWRITTAHDSSRSYTILRQDNGWILKTLTGRTLQPRTDYIRRCLKHLEYFKPSALASVTQKDWRKFGVDDSGTVLHLITKNSNKPNTDIVIGNLSFLNANKANYYVRQKDRTDVYTVDLYLDGSLKATITDMTGSK